MVSAGAILEVLIILSIHTVLAAITTRLTRVRLATRWGAALYVLLIVPVVLVVSTFILSGVLNVGPDLGDPSLAIFITVFVPFALGITIDYIWMPAPEDVIPPDTSG